MERIKCDIERGLPDHQQVLFNVDDIKECNKEILLLAVQRFPSKYYERLIDARLEELNNAIHGDGTKSRKSTASGNEATSDAYRMPCDFERNTQTLRNKRICPYVRVRNGKTDKSS